MNLPEGDLYGCNDAEELQFTTPDGAIADYMENVGDEDMTAACRLAAPLKVTSYKRMTVDKNWIELQAERILQDITEQWDEEFGNPYGDQSEVPGRKDDPGLWEAAEALVARAVSTWKVWGCEEVGSIKLDASQIEAVLRAARPNWFPPRAAKGEE